VFKLDKKNKFSDMDKLLGLRCEATELPGRQIISNDSKVYGPTYKTPYQSLYQEITLNFIETSSFLIRDFFEQWLSNIFNPTTNMLAYPDDYRFEVSLKQYETFLDDVNNPSASLVATAKWRLYNSFPTAVNQMPVAWAEDGLHRVTVTLAYEWYTLSTGGDSLSDESRERLKSPQQPPKGSARP
jgi:hypothetical protein